MPFTARRRRVARVATGAPAAGRLVAPAGVEYAVAGGLAQDFTHGAGIHPAPPPITHHVA